jgi:hypothetical protein
MFNKKFLFFLAILLVPTIYFAQTSEKWNGFIEVVLEKESFNQNELIKGSIIITNLENFPISDGKLILHITKGDYVSPSYFAVNENIVYQTKLSNITIFSNSTKKVDFSLINPGPGDYRVDAYSEVIKSEIFGQNGTLTSPFSKKFSVNGDEIKRVMINRQKTYFGENVFGQDGLVINKLEEVVGKIYLVNESNIEKKDLMLIVSVCKWNYLYCDESKAKIIPVGSISPNSEKEVIINLTSPEIGGIYEVNFKLMEKDFIESIYKSRLIVKGENVLLKKIFIEGIENESYSITSLILGNKIDPESGVNEFNLKLKLYKNNNLIEEKLELISRIDYDEVLAKKIEVTSKDFDKICAVLENKNLTYDEECLIINLGELKQSYREKNPEIVKINWNYNEQNEILYINLEKTLINSNVLLVSEEKILFEEEVVNKKNNYSIEINLPKTTALLIVDDFDSKRQQVINLVLDKSVDLRISGEVFEDSGKLICTLNICKEDEVCSGESYESIDGLCCSKECTNRVLYDSSQTIPLILIIALILFVISIFVIKSTKKKVVKK